MVLMWVPVGGAYRARGAYGGAHETSTRYPR